MAFYDGKSISPCSHGHCTMQSMCVYPSLGPAPAGRCICFGFLSMQSAAACGSFLQTWELPQQLSSLVGRCMSVTLMFSGMRQPLSLGLPQVPQRLSMVEQVFCAAVSAAYYPGPLLSEAGLMGEPCVDSWPAAPCHVKGLSGCLYYCAGEPICTPSRTQQGLRFDACLCYFYTKLSTCTAVKEASTALAAATCFCSDL